MISVITPTIRPWGLDVVSRTLQKQTYKEWEWLIVTPYMQSIVETYTNGVPFQYIPEPKRESKDVWTINKAYNAAIKASKGELLFSWTDFAHASSDLLDFSWNQYQRTPTGLYSHSCNVYADEEKTLMLIEEKKYCMQGFRPVPRGFILKRDTYLEFEWNLVSVPRKAIYDVGGFDEEMDMYFGLNEVSVNNRIFDLGGYDFFLCNALDGALLPHEYHPLWGKSNSAQKGGYAIRRDYLRDRNIWPVLGYLKEGKGEKIVVTRKLEVQYGGDWPESAKAVAE